MSIVVRYNNISLTGLQSMALDGYDTKNQPLVQGWDPDAKRDIDVNKDGKPNNEDGEDRYYQIREGQQVNNDIFGNMFANTIDNYMQGDPETLGLQNRALGGAMFQGEWAANLSERMRDSNLAASMDMMTFADDLSANQKSRDRYETSMYGKDMMGFSADLQNRYANEEFGRGLRALSATGEQDRKTIYAEADATNMGRVVQGEQDRQMELARSDRDVRGIAARGDQNVRLTAARGDQDRRLSRTQGDQDRQLERVRSDRDVRKAGAEGFQTRLIDSNRSSEERRTLTHEDRIDAGRENRQRKAANTLARAM